ncbi:MAG: hypothetical protein HYU67_04825 [Flavobacteriia bacterium]|nr:hypothetical protein [Flavobacteriia bacterium]
MNIVIKNKFTFILLCNLFFLSCSGENKNVDKEVKVEAQVENTFNSDDYDFVLPQPISLAKAFQASGLSYHPNLTHDVSKKDKYFDKVKQLLNLGVYSTDLAYSAINEHANEARAYLKAIQLLGNQVGLKPVFSDKDLIDRFDKSLNNMESVEELIYEIQERSEEYMQDNDLRYLSIVQFSGAWSEGMYLGIKDIELSKEKNEKMSVTVVDQMNLLKNIIKGLSTYPNSDTVLKNVNKKLNQILTEYNEFESVKKSTSNDVFVSPVLTDSELKKLSLMIYELRTFIIQ